MAGTAMPACAQPGWGGAVTATTDYVVRGISQSNGDPALQLDVHFGWPAGWYAGAFASSLGGNSSGEPKAEINAYAGRAWALGATSNLTVGLGHYWYSGGDSASDYNYDELSAAFTYQDRFTAAVVWLPDRAAYSASRTDPDRGAWSYELSSRFPAGGRVDFSLGAGYYDVHGITPSGYWFWNAGLGGDLGPVNLTLSWFGTDHSARSLFYNGAAGQRWAATANWRF